MDTPVVPVFRSQRRSASVHALAYNLGNLLRTLATPEPIKDWSLTSLREKLIKIGAKLVRHGRDVAFQMAEFAVQRMIRRDSAANCGIVAAAQSSASLNGPVA